MHLDALTAGHWLTIALFVAGSLLAVASFLLRRFIKAVDGHGESIAKLQADQAKFVQREVHDVANAQIAAIIERMRIEGHAREERILEAIERSREQNAVDTRALRGELSGVHQRIDRLREQAGDRHPRRS